MTIRNRTFRLDGSFLYMTRITEHYQNRKWYFVKEFLEKSPRYLSWQEHRLVCDWIKMEQLKERL